MIRAIMHGCNGKMGQVITGLCREDGELEINNPVKTASVLLVNGEV